MLIEWRKRGNLPITIRRYATEKAFKKREGPDTEKHKKNIKTPSTIRSEKEKVEDKKKCKSHVSKRGLETTSQ